jgi:hypothetical protein
VNGEGGKAASPQARAFPWASDGLRTAGAGTASRRRARRFGRLLAVALCACSYQARADRATADATYAAGLRLYDAKKYTEAADAFGRAYDDQPTERYLWNLVLAELSASRAMSALNHLRAYAARPDATKARLASVEILMARARSELAHITVEAPAGYTIYVDGRLVGTAPLAEPVDVEPDVEHDVAAEQGSARLSVHVGVLGIGSTTVKLAETPVELEPWSDDILKPPAATPPSPRASSLSGSGSARTAVVLTEAGLTAVAAGVGTWFWIATANDKSTAHSLYGQLAQNAKTQNVMIPAECNIDPALCNRYNGTRDTWSSDYGLSVGAFVVAGGLAAVTVATYLLWPKSRTTPTTAWIVPQVGSRTAGIGLGGSF